MDYLVNSDQINLQFPITELQNFLYEATQNTYAAEQIESQGNDNSGYKTLTYSKGEWNYEDKYTGYFRSWGSETIRYNGRIVWKSNYGGGLADKYFGDKDFALEIFSFLKLVMRSKPDSKEKFYLRGPEDLHKDDWRYVSELVGDVTAFSGSEQIYYQKLPVFYHRFIGGLAVGKDLS